MFSSHTTFNACVNKELKSIGEKVGVPGLNFYSARHSWATLAVNTARVDKYTVHAALNHADTTMRVTDIYIKKDYSLIDEANEKVLDIIYSPLKLADGIQSLECF
jgi:integrase